MKVKLNKDMVKKYWFHLGGDLSETMGIAVDHAGNPITYAEFLDKGGTIKPICVLELEEEFLVVDHANPIPKREADQFTDFFNVSDQDNEAFEEWMKKEDRHDGVFGNINNFLRDEWIAEKTWQAACEYKQKEIERLNCYVIAGYKEGIKQLQSQVEELFKSREKLWEENIRLKEILNL